MKKLRDQIYGCIIGGAIGDALGAPLEFLSFSQIVTKYGKSGVKTFVEFEKKGCFTDDTQMTLFTIEGLCLAKNARKKTMTYDGNKMFRAYMRWLKTQGYYKGKFISEDVKKNLKEGWLASKRAMNKQRSPGITCLQSLIDGKPGSIKIPINNSKGCGGIMRVAPLGLSFPPIEAFKYGCKTAALTHGHPTGYLSAGFLSCLIAFIIRGSNLHEAIINTRAILQTYQGWEEVDYAVLSAIYFSKTRPKSLNCISSMGGGWVAEEALSIALYCCLSYPDNFDKAIALAVNHGGDSDSTGAITGNIIGACIGHSGIAKNWLDNLENYELLLNTLHIFTKHLSSKS